MSDGWSSRTRTLAVALDLADEALDAKDIERAGHLVALARQALGRPAEWPVEAMAVRRCAAGGRPEAEP